MTMVATGISYDVSFTTQKLQIKTEARFRSQNLVMSGLSYAVTTLMTHYIPGSHPAWMRTIDMEKLSSATKKTIEMVEKGFGVGEIYPVHSNLVLLTDDTTLFIFEGTYCGVEEEDMWE